MQTSSSHPLAFIVLAAGQGTRMKSARPKVLHAVAGRALVAHAVAAAAELEPQRIVVVVGPGMEAVSRAVAPYETAVQAEPKGTADAVRAGLAVLGEFAGDVVVLYGDTPLVSPATLLNLIAARHGSFDPAVVVMGMRPSDPARYGRLMLDGTGGLTGIVEYLDATPEQRAIGLVNGGFMAFDGATLPALLASVGNANAKGEYYLTDTVAAARAAGFAAVVVEGPEEEALGVNSRAELAGAERLMQQRLRARAMAEGVTMTDPDSVFLCFDTTLGRDVTIGPNVVFGPGVSVADNVDIKPFCHLEGVRIAAGAIIGPFARLRPGADVGEGAHIGNFVELKNTRVDAGAKVNHLTYLGDAVIGERSNIGAGTITCNYDGYGKHRTIIGKDVFVGSDVALVAPVSVGDGAIIAAGSVITEDVPAEALALARGVQTVKAGRAPQLHARFAARAGKTPKVSGGAQQVASSDAPVCGAVKTTV